VLAGWLVAGWCVRWRFLVDRPAEEVNLSDPAKVKPTEGRQAQTNRKWCQGQESLGTEQPGASGPMLRCGTMTMVLFVLLMSMRMMLRPLLLMQPLMADDGDDLRRYGAFVGHGDDDDLMMIMMMMMMMMMLLLMVMMTMMMVMVMVMVMMMMMMMIMIMMMIMA